MEYIEYQEISNKTSFHFTKKKEVRKGLLFALTQRVWYLQPNGKTWQLVIYYFFFIALVFISVITDIIVLLLIGLVKIIVAFFKWFSEILANILKKLFSELIYPFIKNALIISLIIPLVFILFFRFTEIKIFILTLFDSLIF